MSSSSSSELILNRYTQPLFRIQKSTAQEKRDWVKTASIASAAVGGVISALAFLCIQGTFPIGLLGGPLGVGVTLVIGLNILLPSAYVLWVHW